MPNGLDYSYVIPTSQSNGMSNPAFERSSSDNLTVVSSKIMHIDSNLNLTAMNPSPEASQPGRKAHESLSLASINVNVDSFSASLSRRTAKIREKIMSKDLPKEVIESMSFFQEKRPKGTIDVWWLYDDGGLTMLLPYIISTRSTWANCKIRIFALSNRKQELEVEQKK